MKSVRRARKKLGEVLQGRGEVGPQLEVMRHEALEKCVALLTPGQKKSWEQMTGPAFTFDMAEPGRKRN